MTQRNDLQVFKFSDTFSMIARHLPVSTLGKLNQATKEIKSDLRKIKFDAMHIINDMLAISDDSKKQSAIQHLKKYPHIREISKKEN